MGDDLPITAGGAIFRRLQQLGVSRVFVNSGTDFPPIIEGLAEAHAHDEPLPGVVLVPHEHVAMSMAHGHYFATGEPAAVVLHTNVGLANGVIGTINAACDHVPTIVMSGRTPAVEAGRFGARTVPITWGQEMRDQGSMVRELCKWDYEVRFPEQVPELIDRAYAIATSTPKGPVYLSLPREVLCEPCPPEALAAPPRMRPATIGAVADGDELARAARLLAEAERPLIVAQRGAGTAAGFAALAEIADRWTIPVCQYWANAIAVSAEHPMDIGVDPGPWLADADVVLVVDSLAPWSPDAHTLAADAQVIQLGPNPLYSRFPVRNFPVTVPVVTETGPGLVALRDAMAALDDPPDRSHARVARRAAVEEHNLRRRAQSVIASQPASAEPMTKAYVGHCVGEAVAGRRATVLSELGAPFEPLRLTEHDSWRQEPHSGGLGWSLPCAMGIKLADPGRLVVATMGDGSYMFANPVAAHHTAEAHGIAVLTVILNNAGYGAVEQAVSGLYPTGYASKADAMPLVGLSPSPAFELVARSCRAWAETVTDAAELPGALARAIEVVDGGRQAVLDVKIS